MHIHATVTHLFSSRDMLQTRTGKYSRDSGMANRIHLPFQFLQTVCQLVTWSPSMNHSSQQSHHCEIFPRIEAAPLICFNQTRGARKRRTEVFQLMAQLNCPQTASTSCQPASSLTGQLVQLSDNVTQASRHRVEETSRWAQSAHRTVRNRRNSCYFKSLSFGVICYSAGLPSWLPANAGDVRNMDSMPGLGRSLGGGHGNPLQYSCLENPMDRGALWATVQGSQRAGHN